MNNCHSRNASCALRFYHVISCNVTISNSPLVPSKTESFGITTSLAHIQYKTEADGHTVR